MNEVDKQFFKFLDNKKNELNFYDIVLAICNKSDVASYLLRSIFDDYFSKGFYTFKSYLLNHTDFLNSDKALIQMLNGRDNELITGFFRLISQTNIDYNSIDFLLYLIYNQDYCDKLKTIIDSIFSKNYGSDIVEKCKTDLIEKTEINSKLFQEIYSKIKLKTNSISKSNSNTPQDNESLIAPCNTNKHSNLYNLLNEKRQCKFLAHDIAEILKENVVGQDDVCDDISKSLVKIVNGISLIETNLPIGRMLFCGPSGSGKTFLAKLIAKEFFSYNETILDPAKQTYKIIPCSEYSAEIDKSKLYGGSPNYVGYGDGTPLTDFLINLQDNGVKGVLVFDEIEKMHPKVQQSLLTILNGDPFDAYVGDKKYPEKRTLSLKDVLVIFTSNLASDQLESGIPKIGFKSNNLLDIEQDSKNKIELIKTAAKQSGMSTEFFNRITNIYTFKPLTEADYKKIAEINCQKTLKLIFKNFPEFSAKIDNTASDLIAKKAYISKNTRIIEEMASEGISDLIIEKLLLGNSDVDKTEYIIKAQDDKLVVEESEKVEQQKGRKAYA